MKIREEVDKEEGASLGWRKMEEKGGNEEKMEANIEQIYTDIK